MPRLNPFAWGRTKLTKLWEGAIDGHVIALAWSDALGLIAAASVDGLITLFDAKTGQVRFNLPGHGFGTASIAWSPDGQCLASAGQDGKVRLWNATTGVQTHEMPGGAAWVERVAWNATTGLLASAAGKKLRLWNRAGEMVREYLDHPSTIADIQWHPMEPILASTGYGKVFFWSPEQQEALREFAWSGSMLALAWSPDAKHIAAGAQDCTVHFWLLETGEDLQMSGYPRKVRELAWDPTGRFLATGGADVSCVWDFAGEGPAGSEPIQLEAHKDYINALAYQHQGELLASGGEDGQVILWMPSRQRGAVSIAKHDAPVSQVAWSADDKRLAAGTEAGGVFLYGV